MTATPFEPGAVHDTLIDEYPAIAATPVGADGMPAPSPADGSGPGLEVAGPDVTGPDVTGPDVTGPDVMLELTATEAEAEVEDVLMLGLGLLDADADEQALAGTEGVADADVGADAVAEEGAELAELAGEPLADGDAEPAGDAEPLVDGLGVGLGAALDGQTSAART